MIRTRFPGSEYIYMRIHICRLMTKVISLSERAYVTLKKLKRPNESFSDVVLRMTGQDDRKSILEFAGTWKGNDIDEIFSQIMKDRERSTSRKIEI
jgi:predicted CopG family antitoxin